MAGRIGGRKRKLRLCARPSEDPNFETKILQRYFADGRYKTITTNYSRRIESDRIVFCVGAPAGPGLMALIGIVRAHVRKRQNAGLVHRVEHEPKFVYAREIRSGPAVELDMRQAYATAAWRIGAIDDTMRERLAKLHKDTRLKVVGSLGTRRIVAEYRRGKKISEREEVEATRPVWKAIQAEVDRVLKEASDAGAGYCWTDAAFCAPERKEKIRSVFEREGFTVKAKKVYVLKVGKIIALKDGRYFPAVQR